MDAPHVQPVVGLHAVLKHCWLGTTTENQLMADERLEHLRQHEARVHFVSAEPLLEAVDLRRHMWPVCESWPSAYNTPAAARAAGAVVVRRRQALVSAYANFIDWVIVGGESGGGARPFALEWARSLIEQCRDSGTACFVKQLGARPTEDSGMESAPVGGQGDGKAYSAGRIGPAGTVVRTYKLSSKKGGEPAEWPADLRVRQFPTRLSSASVQAGVAEGARAATEMADQHDLVFGR